MPKDGDYYFQTIFINYEGESKLLKDRIYIVNSILKMEDFLIFILIEKKIYYKDRIIHIESSSSSSSDEEEHYTINKKLAKIKKIITKILIPEF